MKNSNSPLSQNGQIEVLTFLTNTLGTDKYQLLPLAGDASNRRYYRIICNNQSWVLMQWEPFVNDSHYPFLSVLRHFSQYQIQVPKVKALAPQLGLVLLEDLGDLTLERKFWESQNQEHSLPYYHQAIDELLKIHFPASANRNSPCTALKVAFDTEKFVWEMNYGKEHLFEKLGNITISEAMNQELQNIFAHISTRLDQEPKFISHRDYHSRNLMIKLGKMRVIDFQDARLGPIQYDLVSLLHDSYVNLSPESRTLILNYYLDRCRRDYGQEISQNQFDEIYRLQVVQRCFKACGSFSSFFNQRGDKRYLKYIQPTIRTVLSFLEFFPNYKTLQYLLQDHGLLEMDMDQL